VPAVYVTHDQDEAFAIAQRMLVLHGGRIVCAGTPAQVTRFPGSAWTAGFLGLGLVLQGTVVETRQGRLRVETRLGAFEVACDGVPPPGATVDLLIRPEHVGLGRDTDGVQSRVRDVVFQKDGFRVRLDNGLSLTLEQPPQPGETLRVAVAELECLG
jgi:ABC-type Fe3+/spermidine/putrescine transport system ATPase subunit